MFVARARWDRMIFTFSHPSTFKVFIRPLTLFWIFNTSTRACFFYNKKCNFLKKKETGSLKKTQVKKSNDPITGFFLLDRKQTEKDKELSTVSLVLLRECEKNQSDWSVETPTTNEPMLILCSSRIRKTGRGAALPSMTLEPVPSCMHIFVKWNRYRKKDTELDTVC